MIVGSILLIIGVIYLLKTLGIIEVPVMLGEILVPLLLIAAGLYFMLWAGRVRRIKDYKDKLFHDRGK